MTLFFQLLDVAVDAKDAVLRKELEKSTCRQFDLEPGLFKQVPGSPFSYWASEAVRATFGAFPPFESGDRAVCQGLATTDDFRFLRAWWEIKNETIGKTWFAFAKGGSFSPFYADIPLVIEWGQGGAILKAKIIAEYGNTGKRIYNEDFYFRPGLTWPLRSRRFAPQLLPADCIFSVRGYCAFTPDSEITATLALFNSSTFDFIFKTLLGRFGYPEFIVGVLQRLPWATLSSDIADRLAELGRRAWSLKRDLDTLNETVHAFLLPEQLRARAGSFDSLDIEAKLKDIQRTIDDLAFQAYGYGGADRAAVEAWAGISNRIITEGAVTDGDVEESEGTTDAVPPEALETLRSWAVGVAFGRFDLRLAMGERQAPPEPDPFDPLPARSPGMIPKAQEAQFPAHPLLIDDLGHPLDLATRTGDVLERVGFAQESPETLRRWLAWDFFPLHIKVYSKSRRKAPIYWQLATPSASYSVWLYIHAFSRDTLYQAQEIGDLKLLHEERKLQSQRDNLGSNPTAATARKELETQEAFVNELRAFLEEVKRVAPLWSPNLDDGVIINFAPLWRLVPHHKPWQKELKATWDALCAGEYDWAHLAMHLWPERVVPKCATDRSLAIAHGLEEVFWVEGENGKWKPRPIPARPVEELVYERTSPAVKAALKSLLEAPAAVSSGGRGRPRRGRETAGAAV